MLEQVAKELPEIPVVKVDVYENERLGNKYSIQAVPTMILFKDGKEAIRMVGVHSKKEILKQLLETLQEE